MEARRLSISLLKKISFFFNKKTVIKATFNKEKAY